MTRTRHGFTLVELLVVVVIIGILAAIAVPKFANTKMKAYQTTMKSDLHNLVAAEEAILADSGHYKAYLATGAFGDSVLHFRPSTSVTDPAITTGSGYWMATVAHSQTPPGFQCAIALGTPNPLVSSAGEGEPICQ